jgi:hypothetical protein
MGCLGDILKSLFLGPLLGLFFNYFDEVVVGFQNEVDIGINQNIFALVKRG